jgi:hypothetical protein
LGTKTLANRKNIAPKMISIQTISPGHQLGSNWGRPPEPCPAAAAAAAVASEAAIGRT